MQVSIYVFMVGVCISDGSCWDITKNKLVKVYQNWGDVFKIEFGITVTKRGYANVFHFSADDNYRGPNYSRIPAVWIWSARFLFVNSNHVHYFPILLGKQYQIIIQQFKDSYGKYWYEIVIDRKSKFKIENTKAKSFSNVKLYASDPWYIPFSSDWGSICDIKIRAHKQLG